MQIFNVLTDLTIEDFAFCSSKAEGEGEGERGEERREVVLVEGEG